MSLTDYKLSFTLSAGDPPFGALIMAAMRKADSGNLAMLKASWPDTWAELQERYNAPGGLLASERRPPNDPTKPKIFVVGAPGGLREGDYMGYALAQDGTGLGSHLCSNLDFVHHDMGVSSDWKHDGYKAHYPDGYQIIWIGEWPEQGAHPDFDAALALNKSKEPA